MPLDIWQERIIMKDNQYLEQSRNRKKQFLRLRLGILQIIHKPLLAILFLPIIAISIFIWVKKDIAFRLLEPPQIIFPIYKYTISILAVLIPLFLFVACIECIGKMISRRDEANLLKAFTQKELRNGCPILMNKKTLKGSNVVMREFYSDIPMQTWISRQEDIADSMNLHFVEKLRYGGKSNGKRIVMYTAKEREITARGDLYDDEF